MRRRRTATWARLSGRELARALAMALALGEEAVADGRARQLPPNAVQPPGASFEDDPDVGRLQKLAIGREAIGASVRSLVRNPICASSQLAGRTAERLAVRSRESLMTALPPGPACAHSADPCDLGGEFGGLPTPAAITLLPGSEASIRALLDLVAGASRRLDLMMYGWQDDPTGREVAAAIAQAARRGVRVRLLVDRTGYLIHNPAAARGLGTFLDALGAEPNVAVIEPPGPFLRFDHRKLAVVDGRVAWSGGMILTESARRRWHNFAYLAEGPIVAQLACVFEERWREVGGCPERPVAEPWAEAAPANATARLIQTNVGERSLKETIYHAVDHARHHIYLENPYFTDEILTAKLASARGRGVEVRAVLTLRGNIRRLNRYETLTANRLLRAGARVFLYPAMTHVKAMSADGTWAYIGTGNFDELSLRNNREVGLSVSSPGLVGQLDESLFLPDMAASEELRALLPQPQGRWKLELWALWY